MALAHDVLPVLEKYELLEELGHGGMATVYRARDRRLGREVAVKIIHRHLRDEREVAERFAREARAVAKLRHPGIVEVFDVSEPSERERYLVVELVRGATLRTLLRERSPFPPEIGACLGVLLADALQHAHDQDVVHRDIKPENVLIGLEGSMRPGRTSESMRPRAVPPVEVKLTDFGIAKVLDLQGVTSTGQVLGSPAHMAPEQIEGAAVGPAADIFALGVLLHECMVGKLPFEGNNPAQVLRRVLEGQFPPPDRVAPHVGVAYSAILCRALAHEPTARYASMTELGDALRTELERVGIVSVTDELTAFFAAPNSYRSELEARLLPRLVAAARLARQSGEVILAAGLFNRALAYQPDNREVLKELAWLARRHRLRSLGWVALLPVVLGVGVFAYRQARAARRDSHAVVVSPTTPLAARPALLSPLGPESASSQVAPNGVARNRPALRIPPRVLSGAADPNRASAKDGSRSVQVVLTGAAGGRLRIDGAERPWFGVRHDLSFGSHRFEVLPPNDTCCVVPPARDILVAPGDGEQRVSLAIEFRPSQLVLSATEGSSLSCGELFPGALVAPGRKAVRISRPETRVSCSLLPAPSTGQPPRTVDVVLRPGGSFTVSGP